MKKIVALLALVAIVVGNSSCERILDFKADTTSQIPADSAIVTIEDALELRDRAIRLPLRRSDTFKTAAREEDKGAQGSLDL